MRPSDVLDDEQLAAARAAAHDAPPPPPEAIALLQAMGFPFRRRTEQKAAS